MVIAATFLKPRERRIREEGRAEGREEERAVWLAWYYLSEAARAKGEKPPPPPFLDSGDNEQSS